MVRVKKEVKMNSSLVEPLAVNLTVNFNAETSHVMVPPSEPVDVDTGNSGCVYCLTKVVHPRLGRGESYACGYKPYRCEICNYSTVTKGNLAIHEQSDRHLNNLQEYDQQQKLQCVHKSSGQDTVNASVSNSPTPVHCNSLAAISLFPQAYFAFLETFSQKGGTCQVNDYSTDLLEVADHTLFCQICGVYGTDSVEELISHAELNRIPTNLDSLNQQLTIHMSGTWHCNLCAYRSPLKANFQLHCKTEKHAQRLSLLLHMWEGKDGGTGANLPTNNLIFSPSPRSSLYCQLRCLPCGFFTCSVHKMRVHCQTPLHSFLAGVFGIVVRRRSQLKLSLMTAAEGESSANRARVIYACRRCEMTCTSLTKLMQHFQSADFHDHLGQYPPEPDEVAVVWDFDRQSGTQNCFAALTENSQVLQKSGACHKDADCGSNGLTIAPLLVSPQSESGATSLKRLELRRSNSMVLNAAKDDEESKIQRHSAPPTISVEIPLTPNQRNTSTECGNGVDVSTMNDAQMSQSQLASATHQTVTDGENERCRMHVTADPLSSWLNCLNMQNSELLQELVRLIDAQKQQTIAPRTCDSLFAWFGADNSFYSFIICWLKYQFPQIDSSVSNELVALILELIAHQPNVSGRFMDLRELQQQQAFGICQQCSTPRPFLLPSSASLHFNIHHNEELPALVLEAVEKMENTVIEFVRILEPQQNQVSPMKRARTRLSLNQLEVLRSNFCQTNQLTEATVTDICEKTGLKEKVVKHWFRNTFFKERQRFKEDPSNVDISQTPANQSSTTEHVDEVGIVDRASKPPSSTKRFRTPISSLQQAVLLQYFQADQNPSRRQMDIISSKVNLPKRVVQVWFQNARSRERRMFVKYAPHHSQPTKPNLFPPQFQTPSWQSGEASTQATSISEPKCLVPSTNITSSTAVPASVDRLQQIFNRIFTQMPPLGILQLPDTATGQPSLPSSSSSKITLQPSESIDMDSPLDLSTVSYRSSDHQSCAFQNRSPHASSAATVNETRSDNFCRRNRTSISSTQARFMQWFFQHHKTPTICECENIGRAIGLSRRVVQVWFQNQRAKGKKLARATTICSEASLHQPRVDPQVLLEGNECKLCDVKITRMGEEDTAAVTEHIFSKIHIDRLFATICQGDSWSVEKRQNCLPEPKLE